MKCKWYTLWPVAEHVLTNGTALRSESRVAVSITNRDKYTSNTRFHSFKQIQELSITGLNEYAHGISKSDSVHEHRDESVRARYCNGYLSVHPSHSWSMPEPFNIHKCYLHRTTEQCQMHSCKLW